MQVLHKHFLQSELRTTDAEHAQLFFIPVYLGHHFNWFWQQWSTPGHPWEVVRDCEPRNPAGSAECWMEKWRWAQEVRTRLCDYVPSQSSAHHASLLVQCSRLASHSLCCDVCRTGRHAAISVTMGWPEFGRGATYKHPLGRTF